MYMIRKKWVRTVLTQLRVFADVKDDESIYGQPDPSKPRRLVDDDEESPSSTKSDGFPHFTKK